MSFIMSRTLRSLLALALGLLGESGAGDADRNNGCDGNKQSTHDAMFVDPQHGTASEVKNRRTQSDQFTSILIG